MATNAASRPKGRSLRSLRTVWGFALRYPGHIAVASLALVIAAAATSGVPYAFKLIIDKGFATGAGSSHDIARWFEYLLMLVGVMALAWDSDDEVVVIEAQAVTETDGEESEDDPPLVEGDEDNFKITTPADLARFKFILAQ